MNIPKILEIEDNKIEKTMIYKLVATTKNGLLVYENTRTGCKVCYNVRDFAKAKSERIRITTKDRRKEYLEE